MKKIIFIADFFINEILGGAELCNADLVNQLRQKGYEVEENKCSLISPKFLIDNKDCFFFVANFMTLAEETKKAFKNYKYIIIEHDHKYCKTNNPSKFSNLLVPEELIQNKDFYKNAIAVYCQSKLHSETVQKNLLIPNIINVGMNLWSDNDLKALEKNLNKTKTRKFGIIETNNPNKGMLNAVKYCRDNNIKFELISQCKPEKFIEEIAKTETLVFFPQWMETYSRIAVEARILGTKLITNKWIGAASESYFSKKGSELLNHIKHQKNEIINKYISAIDNSVSDYLWSPELKLPKISIITSIYKGEKFIEQFLENVTQQTIFDNCQLILLNANSPENEEKYILPYLEKYKNIIYHRLDKRISIQESMNQGIQLATSDFITIHNIDDRRHPEALEIMLKHLVFDSDVDLVYADCAQTSTMNDSIQNINLNNLYEHSLMGFSKENMIKCLPGPLPLWRKNIHDKYGNFDENLKYAGDWDMWLRAVKGGSKFKKINKILGLYYVNPDGLSTSPANQKERFNEESMIFSKYRDIFGTENFNKFKGYFRVE